MADLFFVFLIIFCFVIHILAVIQCVRARFTEPVDKVVWILVILFLPLIGSLLWYLMDQATEDQR